MIRRSISAIAFPRSGPAAFIALMALGAAACNQPPTAGDDEATVPEDSAIAIDVLANDTDPDFDNLTILGVIDQPSHGQVVEEAETGRSLLRYTPDPDYFGEDRFQYEIGEFGDKTVETRRRSAWVEVTVTPVNDSPVAVDDAAPVEEEGAVVVDVLANDTDVDGDALTITEFSTATHGIVTAVEGGLRYAPRDDYEFGDQFSYTIDDGNGGTATATVIVEVTPVNDAPQLTILEPADGALLPADVGRTFRGEARDAEDGELSSAIEWSYTTREGGGGALGTGASVAAELSAATDSIYAEVTDGGGETARVGRAVRAYAWGRLSGRVVDGDGEAIEGAAVAFRAEAYDTAWTATTDAVGAYRSTRVPTGSHTVTASAAGHVASSLAAEIATASETTAVPPLQLAPEAAEPGPILGTVTAAESGRGIEGAAVELRRGQGATAGPAFASAVTDTAGVYRFDALPAGTYTMAVTADGYDPRTRTVSTPREGETRTADFLLPPIGDLVLALTWGAAPADLDIHLYGPDGAGGRFHVFRDSVGTLDAPPHAVLEASDTAGEGREIIRIGQLVDGTYTLAVHDYTNRDDAASAILGDSGATVTVFLEDGSQRVFSVPSGEGTWWTVLEIDGATGAITPVEELGTDDPGGNGA